MKLDVFTRCSSTKRECDALLGILDCCLSTQTSAISCNLLWQKEAWGVTLRGMVVTGIGKFLDFFLSVSPWCKQKCTDLRVTRCEKKVLENNIGGQLACPTELFLLVLFRFRCRTRVSVLTFRIPRSGVSSAKILLSPVLSKRSRRSKIFTSDNVHALFHVWGIY